MAERRVRNAEVRGSTPLCSTNKINDLRQGCDLAFFICHRFVTWSNRFHKIFNCSALLCSRVEKSYRSGWKTAFVEQSAFHSFDINPALWELQDLSAPLTTIEARFQDGPTSPCPRSRILLSSVGCSFYRAREAKNYLCLFALRL